VIDYVRLGVALALGLLFGTVSLVGYRSLDSQAAFAESLPEPYDRVVCFRVNRMKMFLNAVFGLFLVGLAGSPYALVLFGPQSLGDWILILVLGAFFPFVAFWEIRTIARLFVPDILTVHDGGFSIKRLGRTRDYRWSQVSEPRLIHVGRASATAIEVPLCLTNKRPLNIMAEEYWGRPECMLSVMLHKYRKVSEHVAARPGG
jgi:hypothetical protein